MPPPVKFHDIGDNDDDFQSLTPISYLTQTAVRTKSVRRNGTSSSQRLALKTCNGGGPKRRKRVLEIVSGKENVLTCEDKILDGRRLTDCVDLGENFSDVEIRLDSDDNCGLSFVDSCPDYQSFEHHRDDVSCSGTMKSEIDSSWLNTSAVETCSLSVVESTLDPEASVCEEDVGYQKQAVKCSDNPKAVKYGVEGNCSQGSDESSLGQDGIVCERKLVLDKEPLKCKQSYLCNSIESRLLNAGNNFVVGISNGNLADTEFEEFEPGTQLNELLSLCSDEHQLHSSDWVASEFNFNQPTGDDVNVDDLVCCPLCGCDLSELNEETRVVHTNECLDKMENENVNNVQPETGLRVVNAAEINSNSSSDNHQEKVDVSPVLNWLQTIGLEKYSEVFIREEIDWDTLQWLTEEDLFSIGVTAMGPRKKILHALHEYRRGALHQRDVQESGSNSSSLRKERENNVTVPIVESSNDADKLVPNKLITDYFPAPNGHRRSNIISSAGHPASERNPVQQSKSHVDTSGFRRKCDTVKSNKKNGQLKDAPHWCSIFGTPFRVDAFRFLRRDCSHWFLTHFHIDHYQGLTKSFCHGKIYCSSITAKLINLKIGIPSEKIEILPLNQVVIIAGIEVICFDANHCPGSIIILFKPPNGKVVLHTGDFRFHEGMINLPPLLSSPIHTLILDTTYCDPQYDFPKQDAVIQFVIEAIQAEDFNPKTLFLIGSYTIGKERLFLEVARALRKKVYVNAAKLRLLQCLELNDEDLRWFTSNEYESHIHVVPMWTLASIKRLKQISSQYTRRFDLIVAFTPTGWTFGKGKNKSSGKRWKQGTLIRYEVPYSEHSSFTELKEFVKLISPTIIIPSVNNNGPESAAQMISLLTS